MKYELKFKTLHWWKCIWKCLLWNWPTFCPEGGDKLRHKLTQNLWSFSFNFSVLTVGLLSHIHRIIKECRFNCIARCSMFAICVFDASLTPSIYMSIFLPRPIIKRQVARPDYFARNKLIPWLLQPLRRHQLSWCWSCKYSVFPWGMIWFSSHMPSLCRKIIENLIILFCK